MTYEIFVIRIVACLYAQIFGGFHHSIDSDGQKLFIQRDKTSIIHRQKSCGFVFFD